MRVSPFCSAIGFANNNEALNPGTTATLCAIFAKSSGNWRNVIRKAFFDNALVKDSSNPAQSAQLEQARIQHIKQFLPGVSATNVVRFGTFDPNSTYHLLCSPVKKLPLTML